MNFDQLAESNVPPPPADMADQVHQRLNRMLIVIHVGDFLLRAIPTACLTFIKPALAFIRYSLTGDFGQRTRRR